MKRPPKAKIEVTVDVVVFTIKDDKLCVLLGKRIIEPYLGQWSIPGGFLWDKETTIEAAKRVLKTKTRVPDVYLEQLYTFDEPERDPRGQIITVSYFALAPIEMVKVGNSKEYDSDLFPVDKIPKLAFDHEKIIKYAVKRLRSKLEYTNAAYSLLPTKFTLTSLQRIYEIILGSKQDKRNFRRKYASLGLLKKTESLSSGKHRPAALYTFKKHQPIEMLEKVF